MPDRHNAISCQRKSEPSRSGAEPRRRNTLPCDLAPLSQFLPSQAEAEPSRAEEALFRVTWRPFPNFCGRLGDALPCDLGAGRGKGNIASSGAPRSMASEWFCNNCGARLALLVTLRQRSGDALALLWRRSGNALPSLWRRSCEVLATFCRRSSACPGGAQATLCQRSGDALATTMADLGTHIAPLLMFAAVSTINDDSNRK